MICLGRGGVGWRGLGSDAERKAMVDFLVGLSRVLRFAGCVGGKGGCGFHV